MGSDAGLLRAELAGVCRGTDAKLHRGKLDSPFPVIMGNEIVGVGKDIGSTLARANGVETGDLADRCCYRFCARPRLGQARQYRG